MFTRKPWLKHSEGPQGTKQRSKPSKSVSERQTNLRNLLSLNKKKSNIQQKGSTFIPAADYKLKQKRISRILSHHVRKRQLHSGAWCKWATAPVQIISFPESPATSAYYIRRRLRARTPLVGELGRKTIAVGKKRKEEKKRIESEKRDPRGAPRSASHEEASKERSRGASFKQSRRAARGNIPSRKARLSSSLQVFPLVSLTTVSLRGAPTGWRVIRPAHSCSEGEEKKKMKRTQDMPVDRVAISAFCFFPVTWKAPTPKVVEKSSNE